MITRICLHITLVASTILSINAFFSTNTINRSLITNNNGRYYHHSSKIIHKKLSSSEENNNNVTDDDDDDSVSKKTTYDTRIMEMFLNQKYPAFMQLLSNQKIWEELANGDGGYTIFAPNNKVFDDIGDIKLRQLNDPRNVETTEKIGRYHAISAPVTSKQIYDSNTGGIKTLGGEVPIGKTKTNSFFGFFPFAGKEDGGVTVNGAKIIESFEVTNCIVHEVDGLISPPLLWRYMDQLRIPGT